MFRGFNNTNFILIFQFQLNMQRKLKRRQPQSIQSMDDPFNPSNFNFTQIPDREILFKLKKNSGGMFFCVVLFS